MRKGFVAVVVGYVFCTFIYFIVPAYSVQAASNPVYKDGDTYVELRDAKELENASPPFSHPYIIQEDRLKKILSSISFREKGVFVKKGGEKVFYDTEVETLAPLIAEALSKSTAKEFLYVSSPRDRALLSDMETAFSVFIIDENLNMAFSLIQSRVKNIPRPSGGSNRSSSSMMDPTSMKSSGFWELALGEGQTYKEGHRNWLVINLQGKAFDVEPLVSFAEEGGEHDPYSSIDPTTEERLKRIEKQIGLTPSSGSSPAVETPATRRSEPPDVENLSQKFRDLKELLDNDLISPEDYKYKKAELLKRESETKKSIPQRLKDLRDLMDEGLITEKDYEKKKRELLDRL